MSDSVEGHYARPGLFEAVRDAVESLGKPLGSVTVADTAPFDELHICGRKATSDMVEESPFHRGSRVLDIGSGLGGPARYLAEARGCFVIGIDLTAEFCRLATFLSTWTGLSDRTRFVRADARALPFPAGVFDGAWLQHVNMNFADESKMLAEVARVLSEGSSMLFHEVLAVGSGRISFPVPWASAANQSFLSDLDGFRSSLAATGFRIEVLRDETESSLAFLDRAIDRIRELGASRIPMSMIVGEDIERRLSNLAVGLREGALSVVVGLAVKT